MGARAADGSRRRRAPLTRRINSPSTLHGQSASAFNGSILTGAVFARKSAIGVGHTAGTSGPIALFMARNETRPLGLAETGRLIDRLARSLDYARARRSTIRLRLTQQNASIQSWNALEPEGAGRLDASSVLKYSVLVPLPAAGP